MVFQKSVLTALSLLAFLCIACASNYLVTPQQVLVPAPRLGQQFTVAIMVSIISPATLQLNYEIQTTNPIGAQVMDYFFPSSGFVIFNEETNVTEEIVTVTLTHNPFLINGTQSAVRFSIVGDNNDNQKYSNVQTIIIIQDTSTGGPYVFLDPITTFVEKHKLYQQISVAIIPPPNDTVIVSYNTVPIGNTPAVAGVDFTPKNGTLAFSPQSPSSQIFTVDILPSTSTNTRLLTVVINTTGATIPFLGNTVTLTIGDISDPYGSVYLVPSYQTLVDNGTVQSAQISAVLNPYPTPGIDIVPQALLHYYLDIESTTAHDFEYSWPGDGYIILNRNKTFENLPLITLNNVTIQKDVFIVIKIDLLEGSVIIRHGQAVIIIRKSDLPTIVTGDPHFTGFFGGNYDVKGENNSVFNILSDKNIQVNAKFFAYHPIFQSTFITEAAIKVGLVDRVYISTFEGKSKAFINDIKVISNTRVQLLGGSEVIVTESSIRIFVDIYAITIEALQSKINLTDGTDLEVSFLEFKFALLDENVMKTDGISPHGLVGQTANQKKIVMSLPNAEQGEGVIEGDWTDYIVKSGLWGNDFKFNKYDPDVPQDIAFFEQILHGMSQELRSSLINNKKNIPVFYLYQQNPEIFMGIDYSDQN